MSKDELHEVGAALSWGFVALSRATSAAETTTRRRLSGAREIRPPIAAWLRKLAEFHRANPPLVPPPYIPASANGEDGAERQDAER